MRSNDGANKGTSIPDRETELACFVRARRQAAGLSLRALAELAGVGVRALWELEHGKPTLRMDLVNAVLAVFGKRLGIVEAPRPADEPERTAETRP